MNFSGTVEFSIIWVVNVITILVSIVFLNRFLSLREKSYGSYMIFILNICAFIYPITDIISKSTTLSQTAMDIVYSFEVASYRFSLFWTGAIAYFTYNVLTEQKFVDAKRYISTSLGVCLLLTSIFPYTIISRSWGLMVEQDNQGFLGFKSLPISIIGNVSFFIVYNLIGKLIPVAVISACYFKVYKSLKLKKNQLKSYSTQNVSTMLWYIIVPVVCFVPGAIIDLAYTSKDFPLWANFLVNFAYRLWGLVNLVSYFSVQANKDDDDEELDIGSEMNTRKSSEISVVL